MDEKKGDSRRRIDDDSKSKVSSLQTCWNIFNANQGVGILSMPYAVSQGKYFSLIIMALVALTSNYTNKRLVRCLYEHDPKSGEEVRVRFTYEDVGYASLGKLGKWIVYAAIIVEQLSYCTILLILSGTILCSSFPGVPLTIGHWAVIAFLLIIPNAFMMHISQVSFLSFLTVVIGQLVYISMFAFGFSRAKNWRILDVPSLQFCEFYIALGIITISYSSQPYIAAIEESMKEPKKFNSVMNFTYFLVTLVKIGFGTIGYLTFKSKTKQVITNNLPNGALKIAVNLLVFALALASFSFPAYTVFIVVDKLIEIEGVPSFPSCIPRATKLLTACKCTTKTIDTELSTGSGSNDVAIETKKEYPPYNPYSLREICKRAGVRLVLISGALTMAICVPYFGLYMSLVGNITGMCLVFIFPCIFHLRLKKSNLVNKVIQVTIITVAAFSLGAGMYSSSRAFVLAYRYGMIE